MKHPHIIARLFSGIAILGLTTGFALTPAFGAVPDVVCAGTDFTSYSPGLLLTNQQVTVESTSLFTPCVSSDPTITSGSDDTTAHLNLSCLSLLAAGSGATTLHWNNGLTSHFKFNRTVSNVGGQTVVTYTGFIDAGKFVGDTALMLITGATPNLLECLASPGITSTIGAVALTITGT